MDTYEPLTAPASFLAQCETFGFEMPEETLELLGDYLGFLHAVNKQMNLTGAREPEELWLRHAFDSLTLFPFVAGAETLIDVGSGGGFPAIVLAIACPDLQITMVESTGKKCEFLQACIDNFELENAKVRQGRAETLAHEPALREAFDIGTARGLAALPTLLEYLMPFVQPAGLVLAMKGRRHVEELEAAEKALHLLGADEPVVHTVDTEGDMVILEIPKDRSTPDKYPRETGIPKKFPL